MEKPLFFSIVIPTYNREAFIVHTLQSVLAQTYPHFEVIVVDDGGKDNTKALVEGLGSEKISYYYKENEERAAARNFGIAKAQGDYITFLDSDDLLYPNHFEEASKLLLRHQKPEWVHLAYEIKDSASGHIQRFNQRKGDLGLQLLAGNHLSCIGVFVRREVMEQHRFNPDRELSGSEDWELWLRLASRFPLHYSNTITACMIQHDSRSVMSVDVPKLVRRLELCLRYVLADKGFQQRYADRAHVLKAHHYAYIALHAVLAKDKKTGLSYLLKTVGSQPSFVFSRKFLAICKHLLR